MNFEIKLKISNPDPLKNKLKKINAQWLGVHLQNDIYFDVENGYLKIRRSDNESTQLIQYFKNVSFMGMQSNYAMVSVNKTDRLSVMLTRTHGIRVQVQKIRDIWHWESIHIFLDKVEGLGFYLKLVAQDTDTSIENDVYKDMNRLLVKLKLDDAKKIPESYCELIENKKNVD